MEMMQKLLPLIPASIKTSRNWLMFQVKCLRAVLRLRFRKRLTGWQLIANGRGIATKFCVEAPEHLLRRQEVRHPRRVRHLSLQLA